MLLGIDVGTTSAKAALYEPRHDPAYDGSHRTYREIYPRLRDLFA